MFKIGQTVKIKQTAWERDFQYHPFPFRSIHTIKIIRDNRYMLEAPLHWWSEEDLEIVDAGILV